MGRSQNAANTARAGTASASARRRSRATGSIEELLDFLEVAVAEALLRFGHLAVVHRLRARVFCIGEELRLRLLGDRRRAHRPQVRVRDRKSTCLNSSHITISYAV